MARGIFHIRTNKLIRELHCCKIVSYMKSFANFEFPRRRGLKVCICGIRRAEFMLEAYFLRVHAYWRSILLQYSVLLRHLGVELNMQSHKRKALFSLVIALVKTAV